jgi:hypothetical protein
MATALRPTLDATAVAAAGEFASYCYTPGNLLSYQEEVINHRMRKLFFDPNTVQNDFKFNDTDYSSVYGVSSGGTTPTYQENYVQEVVSRFGANCFGPDGNLPYLEFAFSETGIQRSSFQATSAFTVGGSTFISNSTYGGFAWHLETKLQAGLGVLNLEVPMGSDEGFAMVGAELSTEMSASTTASSEWGINLGEYLNPLGPGEAYSVRLYLLKPTPLWARELKNFGGLSDADAVDTTNSAPIRILFTVPYISDTLKTRLEKLFPGSTDLSS